MSTAADGLLGGIPDPRGAPSDAPGVRGALGPDEPRERPAV
ncbi:hypothetical protein [[Kitasatospora] papulosa]